MKYQSTRGHDAEASFCDILLEGLAPDGGLYMPKAYPLLDADKMKVLRKIWQDSGYAGLAFELAGLFIDDMPAADLRAICERTYTRENFGSDTITPIKTLKNGLHLLGLSNGPTLAFKDMAMQLLGPLFEYELQRRDAQLNILGATSGDTGSAAEMAMRGRKGINVFMLSPHGRMSAFQQAQMFSLQDENIHNIAIEGVFDDCQDIVKAINADADFKRRYRIGAVNSINWARLLAQVVYYFAAYFQVTQSDDERVSFAVPTGNFGNVCAGHIARQMGLPIAQLVVATNENDVLDEFFRTGVYRVRSSADTLQTSSPSMDISKASNFERFVFDLLGRDTEKVQDLFGRQLNEQGQFDLSSLPVFAQIRERYGFVSGHSSHADRLQGMAAVYASDGLMIDPHTADALKVAREHRQDGIPMIVLETALPVKFAETVQEALGRAPERPAKYEGIEDLPRRVQLMPNDAQQVKDHIASHCQS